MSWKWSNQCQLPPELPFSGPRLRWSKELHDKFVSAVNQLGGPTKATPKTIWNIMKVEGLTLFHIKSHLQKYRLGKIPRRLCRRDVVPADGRRDVENDLPENEPMDMEGDQGSSDMNGDETLEAQEYGNLNRLVECGNSVKSSEMTENPPTLTSTGRMEKDHITTYFPEWSELLDGDYMSRTHHSSRSCIVFGSFFDEVAKFPNFNEDEFITDYQVITMNIAPAQLNNNVSPHPGI